LILSSISFLGSISYFTSIIPEPLLPSDDFPEFLVVFLPVFFLFDTN
jgi:hypothetical protein